MNNIDSFINTNSNADNIDFKQSIEWYKNISENHTFTALGNFNYIKGNYLANWTTSDRIFQDAIPIIDDSIFHIFKDKETTSQNFSLLLKHYWVLGDFVHLYTTGGIQEYKDTYKTNEFQELSNGSVNNFISGGFGNDIEFNFENLYVGSHLKFQKGKFTFKPGIFFHSYSRKVNQLSEKQTLNKDYILPELLIKIDLKRSEKLNFRYNRKVRFPSITRLLKNSSLTNFNSIYRGNSNLENELFHQASIYYYKFSLYKKLNYNVRASYRKADKGIKNNTSLEDINYITQPILLDNSDENISFSGNISKGYGDYKLSLGGNSSFANYLQIINTDIQKNTSSSYSLNTGLKTIFLKFPNFDLSYRKTFNNYKTEITTSKFENDNLQLAIEYDFWKDFIFSLDYSYQNFNNKSINNQNQNEILNTSIFYQKENSPWTFEVSANNLFDNQFIRNSSFSDFLISDSKTFVLPRIIMFKLAYKI